MMIKAIIKRGWLAPKWLALIVSTISGGIVVALCMLFVAMVAGNAVVYGLIHLGVTHVASIFLGFATVGLVGYVVFCVFLYWPLKSVSATINGQRYDVISASEADDGSLSITLADGRVLNTSDDFFDVRREYTDNSSKHSYYQFSFNSTYSKVYNDHRKVVLYFPKTEKKLNIQ